MARAANSIPKRAQNAIPNPPKEPDDVVRGSGGSAIPFASRSSRPTLDLESLPRFSFDELRRLWSIHMGRAKCPVQKRILIRELAWRYQERLYGGLDAETKRLLNAAIRAAMKRRKGGLNMPSDGGDVGGDGHHLHDNRDISRNSTSTSASRRSPAASPAKHALKRLPPGARLIRAWPPGSSTKHEVTILDGGKAFEYKGTTYRSLSEVARAITGTRWSGPRFFGLAGRKGDAA